MRRRRPASARGARPARPRATADGEPAPVTTDDSFGKILGDIREELADRIAEGRRHPAVQRVSELIDDMSRGSTATEAVDLIGAFSV